MSITHCKAALWGHIGSFPPNQVKLHSRKVVILLLVQAGDVGQRRYVPVNRRSSEDNCALLEFLMESLQKETNDTGLREEGFAIAIVV